MKKFHFNPPKDDPWAWMPKDQPIRSALSPGLDEIKWHEPGHRFGLGKIKQTMTTPPCRFCGAPTEFAEETDDAIIVHCSTEGCPNNPDTPEWVRDIFRRRKRLGGTKNITEDVY